jgi:hypothetical protein
MEAGFNDPKNENVGLEIIFLISTKTWNSPVLKR